MSNISLLGSLVRETILPLASREADDIGPNVDVSDYTGLLTVTLNSTAATAGSLDVEIQGSSLPVIGEIDDQTYDADLGLRIGATDNIKLSKAFTQTVRAELQKVEIPLKRVGTIASGKALTLSLHSDDAGAPGDTALASSSTVAPDGLATNYDFVEFPFDVTGCPTMEAGTAYHLVLTGDYTQSSVNFVDWGIETVTSGGDGEIYDTTWADSTTSKMAARSFECVFENIDDFDQVTTAASDQSINLLADNLPPLIRVVADVTTGPVTSIVTITGKPDNA